MKVRLFSRFAAFAMALVLTACAAPASQQASITIRQGKIEQFKPTEIPTSHHTGVGAVLGGLAGVGIGSLIGGGTGRDVAMVVGAIGGSVAGSHIADASRSKASRSSFAPTVACLSR